MIDTRKMACSLPYEEEEGKLKLPFCIGNKKQNNRLCRLTQPISIYNT